MTFVSKLFLAAIALTMPEIAQAAIDSGDTAWMMVSCFLVMLMMVPGLALFYGGLVRKENVLATITQTFVTMCIVTLTWVIAGYSLVFTEGNAFIGTLDNWMLNKLSIGDESGTIPESVFILFQLTFAAITTALILGSVADRIRFRPMIVFGAIWSIVVYAPVAHMVWGPGGWIGGAGVDGNGLLGFGHALDFAGGTVVHINAGIAGLVAAIVMGERTLKGEDSHNLVLSMVGASLLWVGWYGFNGGSALAAGTSAGLAILTTQVAASAGSISWVAIEWLRRGKPSLVGAISGAISGLVGITPAAGFVDVPGALAIGLLSGAICFWVTYLLKAKLPIDDSLDVFSIHCMGGIVGAILTGVFAREAIGGVPGLVEGNGAQVVAQTLGVIVVMAYSAVMTAVILYVIRLFTQLRVREEEEIKGLDLSLHGEKLP